LREQLQASNLYIRPQRTFLRFRLLALPSWDGVGGKLVGNLFQPPKAGAIAVQLGAIHQSKKGCTISPAARAGDNIGGINAWNG
jgi:hypothetical protein